MTAPSLYSTPSKSDVSSPPYNITSSLTPEQTTLALPPNDDDHEFAHLVRERMKQRKEKEDAALAHLRVQVKRLEAALAAETKRRVQAVAQVKRQADEAVANVTAQWKSSMEQEGSEVHQRLAVLEDKIEELEERWQTDVASVNERVDEKAAQWKTALERVQEQTEQERKARLQREGRILQQLQQVADHADEQWKAERHARLTENSALADRVASHQAVRDAQVQNWQDEMVRALDDLNRAMETEVAERQTQDAQIVAALNKYTAQVQSSLSFASSV